MKLENTISPNTEEAFSSNNSSNPQYKRRTSSSPNIKTKILTEERSISSSSVKSKNEGMSLGQEVGNHQVKKWPEDKMLIKEVDRLKR